ncbi:MAG: hypothetical protein ACTSYM_05610 [Candidatus Baldrarchaeia archaeon]
MSRNKVLDMLRPSNRPDMYDVKVGKKVLPRWIELLLEVCKQLDALEQCKEKLGLKK